MNATTGEGATVIRTAFKEQDWEHLLAKIDEHLVVPIVGPELLEVTEDGVSAPLYRHLAFRLGGRLLGDSWTTPLQDSTLQAVAEAHHGSGSDPEELYLELRGLLVNKSWPIPESLQKLAAIRGFDLFVSTTFDKLLESALQQFRNDTLITKAYSPNTKSDIPAERPVPGTSLVYQLFGVVSVMADYVVTDDDLLRTMYAIQTERDYQPTNLFKRLKKSNLLILGCCLPDWLIRFLLYAAKGDVFSSGLPGVIADHRMKQESDLAMFLQRHRTKIYVQGGGVEFVDELHRRWNESHGASSRPSTAASDTSDSDDPFKEDAIFISYPSENEVNAKKLAEALREHGLPVWFDRMRLESGDDYERKILRNIERCSFFVPLISRHVDSADSRRFFWFEWNKAIQEGLRAPLGTAFILPVATDDTPADAPFMRDYFRDLHWDRFEQGEPPVPFVEHCVRLFREYKRRQQR